ncbi:MAG: excinuclease ABC subunit UvrC [Candidatus Acetothermia bacterium]|jgi:excinuclease ABC subunit C|nr:excinuclease ABC subunit UvrC [Candidatus Acetothermia bacterium]MDH7505932.1 excinuclease ABC subunit UvrC [Candidatus Acetothermia bacterium]
MERHWQERLRGIPESQGVYLFKDRAGEVIYVGKAGSLRSRVRSYFQRYHQLNETKVRAIVESLADWEYIVTASEVEALVLEEDLIKSYRPRFNVRLKDDKRFPYLAVTLQEPFPRLLLTRRAEPDRARYFGPYTNAQLVRESLSALRALFPIRGCNDRITPGRASRKRACLDYSLKQCAAPCVGKVAQEEYRRLAEGLCRFLEGRRADLLEELRAEMAEAARALEFERAARLRDRIAAFERLVGPRPARPGSRPEPGAERDALGLACAEGLCIVQLFSVRDGRVRRGERFALEAPEGSTAGEALSAFLRRFYSEGAEVPQEVLLPQPVEEPELLERWLAGLRGGRVRLLVPRRGPRLGLVRLASRNAELALAEERLKARRAEREQAALEELQRYLGLQGPPRRIEGYDISTIQGSEPVGAMVVFENGLPRKSAYRRFRIKGAAGRDDLAMLAEVLGRRIADERFPPPPDLVLLDGGKGQLAAARAAMRARGWAEVPAVALTKEFEEVFVEGRATPLAIPKDSPALYLLQRVRDEAHRFAVEYHRLRRKRRALRSELEGIPGIGPKRARLLLRRFGSLARLREASLEDLLSVPGLPKAVAERVYRALHEA